MQITLPQLVQTINAAKPRVKAPGHVQQQPIASPSSPVYKADTAPDTQSILDVENLREKIIESFLRHSAENVEVEYKKKVPRGLFQQILNRFQNSTAFEQLPVLEYTDNYNNSEIRQVIANGEKMYVWKKRIHSIELKPLNAKLAISSEHDQPPPHDEDGYVLFRKKKRYSFLFQCWRFDLTEVKTNDERYKDEDEGIFEIELELLSMSDFLLYYTLDHLIQWGFELFSNAIHM